METVTFSEKNSYTDFGLILSQKEIGEAVPRTNYVDVPARDGALDLTEAFGEVKYNNRTHVFTFSYIGHAKDWLATVSAVTNYINGKKHKIFIEANYYWIGRCTVKPAASQRGIREIIIECDCEPYKYRLQDTVIEISSVATITNDRKTVTPKITVLSGTPTLNWTDKRTGTIYNLALPSTYDNKALDFKLYEGANTLTVSGGNIRLTYREGSL